MVASEALEAVALEARDASNEEKTVGMTLDEFIAEWQNDSDRVLVHTSGSTGKPKPLWVEKRRMAASARVTCRFLGLKAGDTALLCLSLDYIAGKMMVVRSLTCGLRLVSVEPSSHPLAAPSLREEQGETFSFAAMVPLQVWNSLQVHEERERLRRIRHLIIGGGAIDEALERELHYFPHAVWSTYGMTETLSHIALRRLNGPERSEWYTPFDGVQVTKNEEGCLHIDAPEVCEVPLDTNDLVELAPDGRRFRILGRRDNVVCSGGVKLQIEEIERKLKEHIGVPFMITKCKDSVLGEALVLLVEGAEAEHYREACRQVLSRYEVPRHYYTVGHLPMTATGKPARREAEALVKNMIS